MKRYLGQALIVLCSALISSNSLHNGWHWDDYHSIRDNAALRDPGRIPSYFTSKQAFSVEIGGAGHYRPVLLTTYALNYWASGLETWSWHAVNIAIHGGSALLVRVIALRLGAPPGPSLLAGLIFAVTPFNSEAVNYLSARSSLLTSFFILLSFYGFVRFRQGRETTGSAGFYILFLSAGLLALMTKELAIILPGLLIWHDLRQRGTGDTGVGAERSRILFRWFLPYVPFLAALAAYLWTGGIFRVIPRILTATHPRGFFVNLATQTTVLVHYVGLFLLPVRLNADHEVTEAGFGSLVVWTAIALLIGIALWAWRMDARPTFRSGSGLVLGGYLWFLIGMLPTTLYPLNAMMQEHRAYLGAAGLSWALAILLHGALSRLGSLMAQERWFVWTVSALILIALGNGTILRNGVWRDEETLWTDVVSKYPASPRGNHSLGWIALGRGDLETARDRFQRALKIYPGWEPPHTGLASIYRRQGRLDEAQDELNRALEDMPQGYEPRIESALLAMTRGRPQEAEASARIALITRPDGWEAWATLGQSLRLQGRLDEAIAAYRRSTELHPAAMVWQALARAYAAQGETELAEKAMQQAQALGGGG